MQYLVSTVKVIYIVMTSLTASMYVAVAVLTVFVYMPTVLQAQHAQERLQRELVAEGSGRLPFSEYARTHPVGAGKIILKGDN